MDSVKFESRASSLDVSVASVDAIGHTNRTGNNKERYSESSDNKGSASNATLMATKLRGLGPKEGASTVWKTLLE